MRQWQGPSTWMFDVTVAMISAENRRRPIRSCCGHFRFQFVRQSSLVMEGNPVSLTGVQQLTNYEIVYWHGT